MGRLTPGMLEEVRRRVVEELRPAKIYLFGSRAWGQPAESSDVDLLLVVDRLDRPRGEFLRSAYRCIRGLRIPAEFVVRTEEEMTRFAAVPASLARKVMERGVLLHG